MAIMGCIELPEEAMNVRQALIDKAVKLGKERMAAHPECALYGFAIEVRD